MGLSVVFVGLCTHRSEGIVSLCVSSPLRGAALCPGRESSGEPLPSFTQKLGVHGDHQTP